MHVLMHFYLVEFCLLGNHHNIVGVLNEKTLRFLASLLSIITCGRHTALVEKGACKPFNFFFFFLSTLLGCIPAEKGACETENVVIFFFLLLIFIFCLSINFVTTHGWHTSGERGLLCAVLERMMTRVKT